MSQNREEFKKTHTVAGDIDEIDQDLFAEEDLDGEDTFEDEMSQKSDDVCKKSCKFRRMFSRRNLPELLIRVRYLFPLVTGALLFCLSFGDLFEFYQYASVSTISIFGLYGATFKTAFLAFGRVTDGSAVWYAILQLLGAVVGSVSFLLAIGFSILAAVTALRTFSRRPNDPEGNRMKVIFKIAFPNRVCLFLANAAYVIPFLFPYYFSFVLERFYSMGVEPEVPIYIKSNPCFWVAVVMTVITLVLAIATPRYERRRRMNMFLVEHDEEADDEKLSD